MLWRLSEIDSLARDIISCALQKIKEEQAKTDRQLNQEEKDEIYDQEIINQLIKIKETLSREERFLLYLKLQSGEMESDFNRQGAEEDSLYHPDEKIDNGTHYIRTPRPQTFAEKFGPILEIPTDT